MVAIVPSAMVEKVVGEGHLPFGTVVVVCDPDGDAAALVASRVTAFRTAVFVGTIDDDVQRELAESFCREMFGAEATEIRLHKS